MKGKRVIKFSLNLNGEKVRNLEQLRENYNVYEVEEYCKNGKLEKWLKSRGYLEEAEKIRKLDKDSEDLYFDLGKIFSLNIEQMIRIEKEKFGCLYLDDNRLYKEFLYEYKDKINCRKKAIKKEKNETKKLLDIFSKTFEDDTKDILVGDEYIKVVAFSKNKGKIFYKIIDTNEWIIENDVKNKYAGRMYIYSMNYDGSDKRMLVDCGICKDMKKVWANSFHVTDEYIIWQQDGKSCREMYRCKHDGSEKYFMDKGWNGFEVIDNSIIYDYLNSSGGGLYEYNLDMKHEKNLLVDENVTDFTCGKRICTGEKYIFYTKCDGNNIEILYSMDLKNNHIEKIFEFKEDKFKNNQMTKIKYKNFRPSIKKALFSPAIEFQLWLKDKNLIEEHAIFINYKEDEIVNTFEFEFERKKVIREIRA